MSALNDLVEIRCDGERCLVGLSIARRRAKRSGGGGTVDHRLDRPHTAHGYEPRERGDL